MLQTSQRRSGRIAKEVSVLLFGSDLDGKVFAEETRTVLLSRHGAGVVSRFKLTAEQEIIIRRVDTNREAEVRVVGLIGSLSDSHTYGLAFRDTNINFWGVEFPTLTEREKAARYCLLECGRCKSREAVDQDDIASDVYAINDGIVRYCKHCEFSTIWRLAADDADDKSFLPNSEAELAPSPASVAQSAILTAQPQNRRKRVRARVSFRACIRRPGLDNDIVTCEDMSRGGLRFVSGKRYHEKSLIEVASPYSTGVPGIFVPAEIVYVLELPEKKLFRCGAQYSMSS